MSAKKKNKNLFCIRIKISIVNTLFFQDAKFFKNKEDKA